MRVPFHAKIAPPRPHRAIPRERLFRCLDSLSESPVTWISAPAGSGKTTLIASYIQERGIPALWYRVDEGDSDMATFFYYMAEAAKTLKGKKRPLPLFAPDFRLGIEAFVRHYFSALFAKMPTPGLLVFDNYQDAPEECEFHEVMRNGLKLIPEGIKVFIASRTESPPPFASLKADRCLSSLGWDDLRFTLDEVREMIRWREKDLSEETVRRVYEETQGWAAAIILIMEEEKPPSATASSIGSSAVFDYLSVEVFRGLNDRTKHFLCTTALLPSISPEVASQLTGIKEASALLSYLSRNQYFTEWHGSGYTYHPLFREFLLRQAKENYGPEILSSLRIKAAQTLTGSGKTEEAVRLFLDAEAYTEALPVMLGYAQELLSQGRTDTLEEWAERLPEEMREHPWLLYWRAMGSLVTDPYASRCLLERAFTLFEAQNDRTGLLLSVAGIMNAIFFAWDDCHPLDEWIEWVNLHVDIETVLSPIELEVQVASVMVCTLTWRQPAHPNISRWANRALQAAESVEDPVIRCAAKGHVMDYFACFGDLTAVGHVGQEFERIVLSPHSSPLINLTYMVRAGYVLALKGPFEECLLVVRRVVRLAEETGAYFHLAMTFYTAAISALEASDQRQTAEVLKKMEELSGPGKRAFLGRFLSLRAFNHLATGCLTEALRDGENSAKQADEIGVPFGKIYCNMVCAYVLRRMGRRADAWERMRRINKLLSPLGITHFHYLLNLTRASLFFDEGKTTEGHKALRDAFRLGRERGYAFTLFWYWQPDEMARLCQEALAADIEVEYARDLIRIHHLVPSDRPPEDLSDWPWPVSVRTFGGFELLMGGIAAPPGRRKRPLDFLKILICLGGEEIREETIEDALWPDAEGDVARISLKTTLSRLRKIIGEKAIEVREAKVTINPKLVWLDLWAFESLARRVSKLDSDRKLRAVSTEEIERLTGLAFDIYRGDFLASDDAPWIYPARDRLRARFTKTVQRLGQIFIEVGERDKAQTLYEQAIDRGIPPNSFKPWG